MEVWSAIQHWTYYVTDLDAPLSEFEHHASLISVWREKCDQDRLPAWSDFELEDFEDWWGWLSVIDCHSPDASDWIYRLWGAEIARFTGHEMTGKAMKTRESDAIVDVLHYNNHDFDHMKALFDQKMIGLLEGPVNSDIPHLNWVSTVRLPLADDGYKVDKFLNAVSPRNVPSP